MKIPKSRKIHRSDHRFIVNTYIHNNNKQGLDLLANAYF